jgi:hypothetical protein
MCRVQLVIMHQKFHHTAAHKSMTACLPSPGHLNRLLFCQFGLVNILALCTCKRGTECACIFTICSQLVTATSYVTITF